ncbi:MAG: shikimate dehydrogenase [Bdellovibrionales bacterium]|nr:shikimate dehydrogenase [Bdellovibrionales bacterium]
MRQAGVLGFPVQHSLSPRIFTYLSQALETTLLYNLYEVPPNDLESFVRDRKQESNWVGCNVTVPHKIKILKFIDELSPSASRTNAVNVIHSVDGKWIGHNTDVSGFTKCVDSDLKHDHAVVFGTGGAARAVITALDSMGFSKISVIGRGEVFEKLDIGVSHSKVITEYSEVANLYVNATPVGMTGFGNELIQPWSGLSIQNKRAQVIDLIYKPPKTVFMKWAQSNGVPDAQNGLKMLLEQALDTWEIWFSSLPNRDVLTKELMAELKRLMS